MIQKFGKDSSFFTVTSPDYPSTADSVDQADVIGLTIDEEMGKMTGGTVKLLDRFGVYARTLRTGLRLDLTWGYRNRGPFELPGNLTQENATVFGRNIERRGMRVIVQSPGGRGDDDGRLYYNCNFITYGWVGGSPQIRVWESGNKRQVVTQLLQDIGVPTTAMDVRFSTMSEQYSTGYAERQDETSFQTVNRLALEFQCLFRLGYAPDGSLAAFFLSPEYLDSSSIVNKIAGTQSNFKVFKWRDAKDANVRSWSWQNQEGENGAGDSVKISYVGGKMVVQRFTVENDSVVTWELNDAAVRAAVQDKPFDEAAAFTKRVLDARDFEDPVIKSLFTRVDQTTAPNGYGYTIDLKLFGDPTMTAGMVAIFGAGFPDMFTSKDYKLSGGLAYLQKSGAKRNLIYYIRKLTHELGAQYHMTAEVVDVMTVASMGIV